MNKFFKFNEYVELGKVFKECEAYLIALEHFDNALELSYLPINKNRFVEVYDLRGNTKIFLSSYGDAIIDYNKAIKIETCNPYLFFWRGFAFEVMQEYQQATKDLLISLKLDPDFSLAKSLLDHIENK
tara:strand:- start:55 stop:438 length:384 start_codon:yes stop_codon:yes gene_type:complete